MRDTDVTEHGETRPQDAGRRGEGPMSRSVGERVAMIAAACCTVVVLMAPIPAVAHPSCPERWGSLPKGVPLVGSGALVDVRVGRHACFDRLVVDVDHPQAPGFLVRYVEQVTTDGSGLPVYVEGGARLQMVVAAPAHDAWRRISFHRQVGDPVARLDGFRTVRDARFAGSFEGQSTLAVGVRARLPFRVFTIAGTHGGGRVVLDVAHSW